MIDELTDEELADEIKSANDHLQALRLAQWHRNIAIAKSLLPRITELATIYFGDDLISVDVTKSQNRDLDIYFDVKIDLSFTLAYPIENKFLLDPDVQACMPGPIFVDFAYTAKT